MRRTKRFQMSSCERCSCSGETRGVGALWPWCPWGLCGRGVPGHHLRGREGLARVLAGTHMAPRWWGWGGDGPCSRGKLESYRHEVHGMGTVGSCCSANGGRLLRGASSAEVHGQGERSLPVLLIPEPGAPCPGCNLG